MKDRLRKCSLNGVVTETLEDDAMSKKIDDKKVNSVKRTEPTKGVEKAEAISSVTPVKKTERIRGVGGVKGVRQRKSTRLMTSEEREELFRMINEEAEKLFPDGTISKDKREIIAGAVKMAIDSGLVEEDGDQEPDTENSGHDN